MSGHVRSNIISHGFLRHFGALFQDNASHDCFTVFCIRNTDDLNVGYFRTCIDEFLDFLRINVLSAADNHILQPSGNHIGAVLVPAGQVS